MKIQSLGEEIKNLDRVVNSNRINAVTEMPPVMSDAYEDSIETDEAVDNIMDDVSKFTKNKYFTGSTTKNVPTDPVLPRFELDESLDADDEECDLEDSEWMDQRYDELMSKDRDLWDENDYNTYFSILKCKTMTEDFDHPITEASKKKTSDEDLWSLVYTSLVTMPDYVNHAAYMHHDLNELNSNERYDDVFTDYDGNVVVYGETEDRLDPGIRIAKKYDLEYRVRPTSNSRRINNPDQQFQLTIIIPDTETAHM